MVGHELVGIAEVLPFWLHSGQCAGQGREHAFVVRTPFRGVGSAMVRGVLRLCPILSLSENIGFAQDDRGVALWVWSGITCGL